MAKRPTKAEIRRELERDMQRYLSEGGRILSVQSGCTGLADGAPLPAPVFSPQPPQPRTPIPEVMAALDARRQAGTKKLKPPVKKPRKKILYDDFGEPLREVWEND
ncbi:hypothetical protein [Nitrincola alkalilacustris]|uniref:hypothetical protein n=1 Tax=Nitrincola alkalilacustris TaxID=1571224 RepID=UPI00124E5F21|nr:hypothetical protein [Nitrincola alkalilacustris]